MPQWSRDRQADIASGRDERWIADCPPILRATLAAFDHHLVIVNGRRGVLLSYADNPTVQVSHATDHGHPSAPPEIQAAVEQLQFRRWDGNPASALRPGPFDEAS